MTFATPSLSSSGTSILQQLITNCGHLVNDHWGSSAPAFLTAGMFWSDTGTGLRKQYDGSTWHVVGPIVANGARRTLALYQGVLVGGEVMYLPVSADTFVVSRVVLVSTVATSGSTGGANWAIQLANLTAGNNLFATAPSTNGDELAVATAWSQDVDQNATCDPDDVLALTITKTGSPTSLAAARVLIQVDLYPRAA